MALQSETPAWDWQQSSRGRQNSVIARGVLKLVIVRVRVSARGPVWSYVHGPQRVYLGDIEWSGYTFIEGSLLDLCMVSMPRVLVPQGPMTFLGCGFSPWEERVKREAGRECL